MTIEEIKSLMKSGDIAGAEAAAQELLAAEPDNVQAMMFYGTCRQLQGDEATFRRIHDELEPKIAAVADFETRDLWRKFDGMRDDFGAPVTVVVDRKELDEIRGRSLYACPSYYRRRRLACVLLIVGVLVMVGVVIWLLCVK